MSLPITIAGAQHLDGLGSSDCRSLAVEGHNRAVAPVASTPVRRTSSRSRKPEIGTCLGFVVVVLSDIYETLEKTYAAWTLARYCRFQKHAASPQRLGSWWHVIKCTGSAFANVDSRSLLSVSKTCRLASTTWIMVARHKVHGICLYRLVCHESAKGLRYLGRQRLATRKMSKKEDSSDISQGRVFWGRRQIAQMFTPIRIEIEIVKMSRVVNTIVYLCDDARLWASRWVQSRLLRPAWQIHHFHRFRGRVVYDAVFSVGSAPVCSFPRNNSQNNSSTDWRWTLVRVRHDVRGILTAAAPRRARSLRGVN
ncbi:hypothetical protein J6590_021615 [Homalodisca vitripennis]|nr:hypothetical protein J6590_021615 [Homalodisca vitripennis]